VYNTGKSSLNKIAICDKLGICSYQDIPSDDYRFMNVDTDQVANIEVFDEINLVALPIVCCLCVNSNYFVLGPDEIGRSVSTLNTIQPYVVDARIKMAYSAVSSYDNTDPSKLILLLSESIADINEEDEGPKNGTSVFSKLLLNIQHFFEKLLVWLNIA